MKNSVKISILTATMTVAMMFFGGCSKDDNGPSLVSGGFNGRITATVDPKESDDVSGIKAVVPWNSPVIDKANNLLLGEQMGDVVSYSNNKFTVNLLDPPPSNIELVDVKYAFENFWGGKGTLKFSNPDVLVTDVDFIAHTTGNNDGYFTGFFINASADKKTTCIYVYTESDVTVTGGSVTVSLKEGWNRLYYTEGADSKCTTKAPEGEMKWYYEVFPL